MHFEGEFIVNLPREKVWEYVSDPHSALDYVPNIQELKVQNPDRFTATVGVGVGSIKGNFNLEFEMVENVPPNHTRIKARGSGIKSTVDFETTVDLSATGDGKTNMRWSAEGNAGGLIAGVGQRLLRMAAEKMVSQLFERLKTQLEK